MVLPTNSRNDESNDSTQNSSISCCGPYRRHAKIAQRLNKVIETNMGYQLIQQNGQRIFEPSTSVMLNPPSKGCEIFIGNIPRHLYEDYLIPLFQKVGQIYKFRLMLDFNQRNRGYAFATYFFAHHAKEAIDKYNGYILDNGAALAVFKSIDNRRLFVGNIPKNKTREDVLYLFHDYTDGIVDVIMYPSWCDQTLNRGFAFLEFESHSLASVARRQFHPRNLVVWDHALYVDWADPIPEIDPLEMAQITVLYVKNLPFNFDNDTVYTLLRNLVGPRVIKKTHKILTYAFVHCYDRTSAEMAMRSLAGMFINDKMLIIEWARPRQYSTQFRLSQPPDNFCLSVPLRSRKKIRESTNARRALQYAASEVESQPTSSPCSSEHST